MKMKEYAVSGKAVTRRGGLDEMAREREREKTKKVIEKAPEPEPGRQAERRGRRRRGIEYSALFPHSLTRAHTYTGRE